MDLTLGPEQESIRDAIRQFVGERLPLERVRRIVAEEPGVDADAWREAGELGWFGLGLPEAAGGAGYGLPEEMLLFVELGRSLVPGPWLGTVLAAHALDGSDVRARVLAGQHRVAVVDDPTDRLGTGERLGGTATGVADGAVAHGLLVLGSRTIRYAAADARGVTVAGLSGIDPTRRLADVTFHGVASGALPGEAGTLRLAATVLVAAEAVGVAERALEASVAHAKVRQQFGRPIGSFQAVKHRCADMAVRAEVARSTTTFAAVAVRDGDDEAARPFGQGAGRRRRHHERQRQRPEPRRHGLHLGGGRASVPEARVDPGARLRLPERTPRRAGRTLARALTAGLRAGGRLKIGSPRAAERSELGVGAPTACARRGRGAEPLASN